MTIDINTEKRKQFLDQGFCIFRRVLAPAMVAELNQMSRWMIDHLPLGLSPTGIQ